MDTIKIKNRKKAKIIAHRGGSLEIENTIGAFISSANRSFYGIETDVHKTSDGKYIIYHDDNTSRLTLDNFMVDDTDFDILRALKFKNKNRINRKDIFMPCLEEYIDICKNYNKICVLELKNHMEDTSLQEICHIIEKLEYMHNVIFISFDFSNLLRIRKCYPEQSLQFLADATEKTLIKKLKEQNFDIELFKISTEKTKLLKMLDVLKNYNMDLDVWDKSTDKALIKACHKRKIKVNVFTVNTVAEAERFIRMGADFITTDTLE